MDESPGMLALILGAETVLGDIKSLDLGRRFQDDLAERQRALLTRRESVVSFSQPATPRR